MIGPGYLATATALLAVLAAARGRDALAALLLGAAIALLPACTVLAGALGGAAVARSKAATLLCWPIGTAVMLWSTGIGPVEPPAHPTLLALAIVAAAIVAGMQAALLGAGPPPGARTVVRAAAVPALATALLSAQALPLATAVCLAALLLAPRRHASNDNLPVALGLSG